MLKLRALRGHLSHCSKGPGYCYGWQQTFASLFIWCWFYWHAELKNWRDGNVFFQSKPDEQGNDHLRGKCINLQERSQKLHRNPKKLQIAEMWNIFSGKLQVISGGSTKQRLCGLQSAKLTSYFPVPWMLDIELHDLTFALLNFGFTDFQLFSSSYFSSLGMRAFILHHCPYDYVICFLCLCRSTGKSVPWVSEESSSSFYEKMKSNIIFK